MQNNKPTKTIVDCTNVDEMREFKERRRFQDHKDKGHFYFDKIWRDAKLMTRPECYKWLADKLDVIEAHFSLLSISQCKDAIFYCQQLLNDNRRLDLDFGVKPITPLYVLEN